MRQVPTTEFKRNFGLYREIVQREPVAITSHGRPTAYFISAVEYEEVQRIRQSARQAFATTALSKDAIEDIAAGRMSSEHDHLDALLDDE